MLHSMLKTLEEQQHRVTHAVCKARIEAICPSTIIGMGYIPLCMIYLRIACNTHRASCDAQSGRLVPATVVMAE